MDKAANCLGVRDGVIIRRGGRITVAKTVDLGIDPGLLAAEVVEFVAAEERRQARRPCESEDGGITRNARISVARPVDLGIDPGVLAAGVAEFVAAEERRQASRRAKRARRRARARAAAAAERTTAALAVQEPSSVAAVEKSAAACQEAVEGAERMQLGVSTSS